MLKQGLSLTGQNLLILIVTDYQIWSILFYTHYLNSVDVSQSGFKISKYHEKWSREHLGLSK